MHSTAGPQRSRRVLRSILLPIFLAAAMVGLPVFLPAPGVAHAEADAFALGSGRDGALTITTANHVVNSYAKVTAPLAPGDTSISVDASTGFGDGDLVMVLQTTGIVPTPSSGAAGPIDLSSDPVGRWELARLASVSGTTLGLSASLGKSYAAAVSQVIRVPEYTTLTINSGASITAASWNGATGGVLAFLATGTVTNNGTIRATGTGFRGGSYVDDLSGSFACTNLDEPANTGAQKGEGIANTRYGAGQTGNGNVANGGGGGVCFKSGGGGGGNGGAGGRGGYSDGTFDAARNVGGLGGAALSYSLLDHLTLGGGGGAGHGTDSSGMSGGRGGGAIFIRAGQLAGTGSIAASGSTSIGAGSDGGSGGGAGGSIYLRIAGSVSCGSISALGGIGGSVSAIQIGPGGGGAGGRVLFQAASGSCTINVLGGQAGTQQDASATDGVSYGAQPGATGSVTTLTAGFAAPAVPTLTAPAASSFTNNQQPTITGTAEANTTIIIFLDGVEFAQTTSDGDGKWSFTPTGNLAAGAHQLQAAAESLGVRSAKSAATSFTIDLTPPLAPALTAPVGGTITTNDRPTIAGTAEANSSVTVYLDGAVLGTTTANGSGNWSYTPGSVLADGLHAVKVRVADAAGNISDYSNTSSFTIDTTAPAAPVVVTPANGASTNNNRPTITGTAEATSTLTVYVDNVALGTTTANASGNWSYTLSIALADGSHNAKAKATDAAGNTSDYSSTNGFTIDTAAPAAPTSIVPVNGTTIYTATPTISGTAEPNSTVTVYLDGAPIGTASTDASGNWSYTLGTPLSDGQHTIEVAITDTAGNTGPLSGASTISYVPSQAPAITSAAPSAATYGTAYTHAFAVSGTPAPTLSLMSGTLPPGLSLNGTTLSGTPTAAGSYGPITVKASNGYGPDATQTFTLVVGKAILTATANNQSRTVAVANPTFTVRYSGFGHGDTAASALTGSPSCASTATPASPASSYPIHCTAGTLAASNYTFAFVDGTLTVTNAPSSTHRYLYLPLVLGH